MSVMNIYTPRFLAVSHFFLFQLNAHNMISAYIYHQLPPTVSLFVKVT